VRIGMASGLGGTVSRVMLEHRKHFRSTEIECRDVFSSRQNEALQKGVIDVGFLRPPVDRANLDCELLFEEEFVVVLPAKHPLARRRSLKLKDVAGEPLIVFDRNLSTGLYDKVLGLYSRQGLTPHITMTHVEAHEEAGAVMVACGKGIFIGAGALVNRTVSGLELACVKLNEPEAKIEVYAAWRKKEDSSAVLDFLSSVRRTFRLAPLKQPS
jgi:DNA-binding transcriptional LysR family regulator